MSERLNIRRLVALEKEKISTFDVKKDLTREEWERMDDVVRADMGPGAVGAAFAYLPWMKILDPERALPVKPGEWAEITTTVDRAEDFQFVIGDALLRIMNPKLSLTITLRNLDLANIYKNAQSDYDSAQFLAAVKILDPATDLSFALGDIEKLRLHIEELGAAGDWKQFALLRAFAKIAQIDAAIPAPSLDQWRGMREYLGELRRDARDYDGEALHLIDLAGAMKVLAADSVRITEEGISLGSPAKITEHADRRRPEPQTLEL
jgi:hypothetical protein